MEWGTSEGYPSMSPHPHVLLRTRSCCIPTRSQGLKGGGGLVRLLSGRCVAHEAVPMGRHACPLPPLPPLLLMLSTATGAVGVFPPPRAPALLPFTTAPYPAVSFHPALPLLASTVAPRLGATDPHHFRQATHR